MQEFPSRSAPTLLARFRHLGAFLKQDKAAFPGGLRDHGGRFVGPRPRTMIEMRHGDAMVAITDPGDSAE